VLRVTWFTRGLANRYNRLTLDSKSVSRGLFTFCGLPPTGVTLELDGEKTSVWLQQGKYAWIELSRH
jgi:hypothetical protein